MEGVGWLACPKAETGAAFPPPNTDVVPVLAGAAPLAPNADVAGAVCPNALVVAGAPLPNAFVPRLANAENPPPPPLPAFAKAPKPDAGFEKAL